MRLSVSLLTFNLFKNKRVQLFEKTIDSLLNQQNVKPFDLLIVDNGSEDDTWDYLSAEFTRISMLFDIKRCLYVHRSTDARTTSAHGNNVGAAKTIEMFDPDIVVLSDDDVFWKPDALSKVLAFWEKASEHMKLCGGILESEEYPWAPIQGSGWCGDVRFLYRGSVGAASWTFRARDYGYIFPLYDEKQGVGDLDGCRRVLKQGFSVCAIDAAEHVGAEQSSWGNVTNRKKFAPIDKKKWEFE